MWYNVSRVKTGENVDILNIPTFHSFSMEKIYHFNCGECKNWWSHATDMVYRRGQNMSCPHCGEKRGIVKKDGDENPRLGKRCNLDG